MQSPHVISEIEGAMSWAAMFAKRVYNLLQYSLTQT